MQVEIPYKYEFFLGWQAQVSVVLICLTCFYFLFVGQLVSGFMCSLVGLYFARRTKHARTVNAVAQRLFQESLKKR